MICMWPLHKDTLSQAHRKVRDNCSVSKLSAGSQEPQRSGLKHLKYDSVTFKGSIILFPQPQIQNPLLLNDKSLCWLFTKRKLI